MKSFPKCKIKACQKHQCNFPFFTYHSISFGHSIRELAGHPEVGELGVALIVEKDVAGLDVAVDFLPAKKGFQSGRQINTYFTF